MAFVLDCSVTMAWLFSDEATEATDRLRATLIDSRAFAPSLWLVEVDTASLAVTRRGRIRATEWPQIQGFLSVLAI